MKTTFITLLLTAPLLAQTPIPDVISRPATENVFSEDPNRGDISSELMQGGIFANPSAAPKGGPYHLTESRFGHAFANYLTPHQNFTDNILNEVYAALYPSGYATGTMTGNRDAIDKTIANGGSAFRYKYLLYGATGGDLAILDLYDSSDPNNFWFGDDERVVVREQIAVLRAALAQDPLNITLQHALLETYYDWAVGESQVAKRVLSELARVRLGLITPEGSDTIIDREIETYERLVDIMKGVVDVYGELLSLDIDGVNPSDFDSSAGGAPFGYYIFKTRVPTRSQIVSQYAVDGGDNDAPVQPVGTPGDNPDTSVEPTIFTGYKDYRALLTFLGQRIQYEADLARLKGTRKIDNGNINDLTAARAGLTESQNQAGLASILESMFTDPDGAPIDFDLAQYDESGVRAAKALIAKALGNVADSRAYLNGSANVLGLDPNFLLLLPTNIPGDTDPANLGDTYDQLVDRLTKTDGTIATGPLSIAKDLFGDSSNPGSGGGAVQAFTDFRASVDQVSSQLAEISTDFANEFEKLTGYQTDDNPGFDGINPKPSAPSDLRAVNRQQVYLLQRNAKLIELNVQILIEVAAAQEAVRLARAIEGKITGAQATYIDDTSAAWTEIHVWAGAAAGAAAAYQTFADLSGIDAESQLVTGGGVGVAVGVAGALNTAIQTTAAVRTSMRQQEIEAAAMNFEVTLATSGLELQVQQAIIEVNSLNRDIISNTLEMLDNNGAIAQAHAEKQAIFRDINIAERNLAGSFSGLATSYFADPVFYIRAERAILKAEAAFRNAQRWTFFTCRALEYKWQERFIDLQDSEQPIDISSIFKARNVEELEEILQKMETFNDTRAAGSGAKKRNTTLISLRDQFITPNPADINLTFSSFTTDEGYRYSPDQGRNLTKIERFRELLKKNHIINGNLVIDFNTSILQGFKGGFFEGPDFSGAPLSGNYRDKIVWTAVHLLSSGPGVPTSPEIGRFSGSLTYGGLTYFRTRIPVYLETRTNANTVDVDKTFDPSADFPGEFIVSPVRFFQDTELNGRYTLLDSISPQMTFAESSSSASDLNGATLRSIRNDANGFRNEDLQERAVAASRFSFQLTGPPGVSIEDKEVAIRTYIDTLDDIEVIIEHESYPRPQVQAPNN